MIASEAIARADELRPNTFSDEQKYKWLMTLEARLWEETGHKEVNGDEVKTLPDDLFPDMTNGLIIKSPRDNIYILYLISVIDFYNQETEQYANDAALFEEEKRDVLAWFRRNNTPEYNGNWKVM